MKRLLLLGGGGHCRSVLDSVLTLDLYKEIGIIDRTGSAVMGVHVVGNDSDLRKLFDEGWTDAFISVGSVGNTSLRRKLYKYVSDIGFYVPSLIDPTAVIASDAVIGSGAFVGKRAVINSGSRIGICSIINSAAVVEHDCDIGDFAHISPGAVLCGMVNVGSDAHIGAGSVVRQQCSVGSGALIGIGSVVVSNIPENVTAYGNPCKVVK